MPLTVTKRDGVFLLIAGCLVTLYVLFAGGWGFPLDDSWIHQTYARNLAQNGEWAFLPGEPSAASTSPLYTVVLAIGYVLNIPFTVWAHVVGTLALASTAMLGARLTEMIFPESERGGWWVGLALLVTWHLIWAAASGMETMIFGALTLLLIYLAWRELDETRADNLSALLLRGGLFGIATALTALARPEGVLLGGVAALLMLIVRPQGSLKNVVIYGVGAAVGFAIMLSPYLWLNLQLTAGVLPNTANAKFEQHAIIIEAMSYPERYGHLFIEIFKGGQILLLPCLIAYIVFVVRQENRLRGLYLLLPLFWALGHIAVYAAQLPAWYQHGRYVLPTLPAFVTMGMIGLLYVQYHVPKRGKRSLQAVLARSSAMALALAAGLAFAVFVFQGMLAYRTGVQIINTEMVAAAEYIDNNIPVDELMAIHDIGAVGFFTPRPMIDIAGLVSPEIIPIVNEPEALWAYMEDNSAQYLMAFPDQIPGDDPTDPRLCRIFITNSPYTAEVLGSTEMTMAIYRLDYDATCER